MSKNILLSFLGIGKYESILYKPSFRLESQGTETRYIQIAILRECCSHFRKEDRIFILSTPQASQKHGEALLAEAERYGIVCSTLELVPIKEPQEVEEMWNLFFRLANLVPDHSTLYLDITHSFRYIPMLVTIQIQYLMLLKGVKLGGVYYGSYENRQKYEDGREWAPIFDLSPMFSLYQWTLATHLFLKAGYAEDLVQLAQEQLKPILIETQGADERAKNLQKVMKELEQFTKSIQTAQGGVLIGRDPKKEMDYEKRIQQPLKTMNPSFVPPLQPVLQKLQESFSVFQNGRVENCLLAARWAADHLLIQSAYTLLQEGLISFLVEKYKEWLDQNIGGDAKEKRRREIIVLALMSRRPEYAKKELSKDLQDQKEKFSQLGQMLDEEYPKLSAYFDQLSQLRNNLNHAGFGHNPAKSQDFFDTFNEIYNSLRSIHIVPS